MSSRRIRNYSRLLRLGTERRLVVKTFLKTQGSAKKRSTDRTGPLRTSSVQGEENTWTSRSSTLQPDNLATHPFPSTVNRDTTNDTRPTRTGYAQTYRRMLRWRTLLHPQRGITREFIRRSCEWTSMAALQTGDGPRAYREISHGTTRSFTGYSSRHGVAPRYEDRPRTSALCSIHDGSYPRFARTGPAGCR